MFIEEQWVQWNPISDLAEKYCIKSILDSLYGFKVHLVDVTNRSNTVTIAVHGCRASCIRTDTHFRVKTIDKLRKRYGDDFCLKWTFFRINDSSYIKQLVEESNYAGVGRNLQHFCIIAENIILDIVRSGDDGIEFIKLTQQL